MVNHPNRSKSAATTPDEVIVLRAQNAKLRAALKPFAEDVIDSHVQDDDSVYVFVRHMRAAARALKD